MNQYFLNVFAVITDASNPLIGVAKQYGQRLVVLHGKVELLDLGLEFVNLDLLFFDHFILNLLLLLHYDIFG